MDHRKFALRLLAGGLREELARVQASLRGMPRDALEAAKKGILSTDNRVHWEITDRGTNFDFVAEERRAKVGEVFDQVLAAAV